MRQILEKHGTPREIYSDRSAVFFVTRGKTQHTTLSEQLHGIEKTKTQWQTQCEALGIHLIAALSPEAKGRVERLWQTLQGRLPFIFRFLKITTIAAANEFLKTYVDGFNAQFAVPPQDPTPVYTPLPASVDLDLLLACKADKKTNAREQFIYHGESFHVPFHFLPASLMALILSKYTERNVGHQIPTIAVPDTMISSTSSFTSPAPLHTVSTAIHTDENTIARRLHSFAPALCSGSSFIDTIPPALLPVLTQISPRRLLVAHG